MALSSAPTEQELLQALERNTAGAVVLTSTVRAARAWRGKYDNAQLSKLRTGWASANIFAWEPWLSTLWNAAVIAGAETRMLLSQVQELYLWQSMLEQDEIARQTISYRGLAETAQQAWNAAGRYGISIKQLRGEISRDAQAFHSWASALKATCRKSSYLPACQLEAALVKLIELNKLKLPEEIFLVGFDRITPSQASLIRALQASNCIVQLVELRSPNTCAYKTEIVYGRTLDQEILCAAQWIRQTLVADPSQRIGVIVPAPAEMRHSIDAAFRAILAPSSMDVRAPRTTLPYEFSLGTSMVRLQPVRTALTLLRWLYQAIPSEEVSWLLVHGGFSSGLLDSRAMLDSKFRDREFQLGGPVSFPAFRNWISRTASRSGKGEEFSPLRRTIEALFAMVQGDRMQRSRSFAEWREFLEEALQTAGLHLLTAATSEEYQLLQRWNGMLNELSSLNAVAGAVRFSSALEKLDHQANNTLFALETSDAPVQVLGIAESAGLVFDSVWWMNAQASAWPPHGNAQPFLPWSLQRAAHIPNADPAEDYAFAQRVTQRILNSGKKVVVSFALQDSDPATASAHIPDREVILSPLVRDALPDISMIATEDFLPEATEVIPAQHASKMETIREEAAVPFFSSKVRGGVRFLELQAACPFRSFAELRLGTRPLSDPDNGLSAAAQGIVLHRVLQKFWEEVGSQKNLLQSTPAEHRQILRKHIQIALADFTEHVSETWHAALLDIEAQRVEERLLLWLDREKERPDFTVLQTEEMLEHPQLGGIDFDCRVDRMDAVEQGLVLLDYKTGPVSRDSCEGDRPDQPQLPAYAVLRDEQSSAAAPLAGIAFAGLHPRKIELTIVASLPSVFTALAEKESKKRGNAGALSTGEMQEQLTMWKATLNGLAEDFRSGMALVDPKYGQETCKYCAQPMLCRIREAQEDIYSVPEAEVALETSQSSGKIYDD